MTTENPGDDFAQMMREAREAYDRQTEVLIAIRGQAELTNRRLEQLERDIARSGERAGKAVNRAATRKTLCDPRA